MSAPLPFVPAPGDPPPLDALLERYPWARAMRDTPQDPVFHREGDVWTHTGMVLEALTASTAWRALPEDARGILFWAALLHDVAKPHTTVTDDDGRIRSPRHAPLGERIARRTLWQGVPESVPFAQRERIVKLVRHHGLPPRISERSDPERATVAVSQVATPSLLALLAEADVRGRVCDDADELLAAIDLFRDLAASLDCLDAPFAFPSELARFHYLSGRSDLPRYTPYDESWGEVLLLSGLPGAGKDRWLARERPDLPTVSLDDLRASMGLVHGQPQGRVLQAARELAREHLRRERPFAWNATNLFRSRRRALVDLFTDYGARVVLHYLEPGFETLFARNRTRADPVPEAVLWRYLDRLELPEAGEAHRVELHHGDG